MLVEITIFFIIGGNCLAYKKMFFVVSLVEIVLILFLAKIALLEKASLFLVEIICLKRSAIYQAKIALLQNVT